MHFCSKSEGRFCSFSNCFKGSLLVATVLQNSPPPSKHFLKNDLLLFKSLSDHCICVNKFCYCIRLCIEQ